MSKFIVGNLLLLSSMVLGAGSQVIIKSLLNDYQGSLMNFVDLKDFLDLRSLTGAIIGILMLVLGFVFWILALTKLDLNYAYPIACTSVVFVALFSGIFLGESLTIRMSIGTVFIIVGIILLVPTNS